MEGVTARSRPPYRSRKVTTALVVLLLAVLAYLLVVAGTFLGLIPGHLVLPIVGAVSIATGALSLRPGRWRTSTPQERWSTASTVSMGFTLIAMGGVLYAPSLWTGVALLLSASAALACSTFAVVTCGTRCRR